jgi:hypothetical protein
MIPNPVPSFRDVSRVSWGFVVQTELALSETPVPEPSGTIEGWLAAHCE